MVNAEYNKVAKRPPILKKLKYSKDAYIYYCFGEENNCYFCGVVNPKQSMSTATGIREIAKGISESSGIPLAKIKFYELLTHTGWPMPKGAYIFYKIDLEITRTKSRKTAKIDPGWKRVECPRNVLNIFKKFIGGKPFMYNAPERTQKFFLRQR